MGNFRRRCCCMLLVLSFSSVFVLAKDTPQRTQINRDIRVEAGERTGDVTCINCSIYVHGEVNGDATAIHGNILVASGGSVTGDATSLWGDIRAQNGCSLGGDVTAVGGSVRRQAQARVSGDVTSLGGLGWVLLLALMPLCLFALIVVPIVWLVMRSRRREPVTT